MSESKILVQVNSSFDLYICTALVRDKRNTQKVDLLIPYPLLSRLPDSLRSSYDELIGFTPRIRNLLSWGAIKETMRISSWAKHRSSMYNAVIFGAYRNDITSVLANHFYGKANLLAVKQGIDVGDEHYARYSSLVGIHDDIYYGLFGYSSFFKERLVQKNTNKKADYLFVRPVWKKDPFNRIENVFTIGYPKLAENGDGTSFLMPNFDLLKDRERKPQSGVLIIGERTPMTPSWGGCQSRMLHQIFEAIKSSFTDDVIYVRGRKGLTTSNDFYSTLKPVYLDPEQHYDDQLLKLNPKLVISVKSTATKIASYYGYYALLLYPSLGMSNEERFHVDWLFSDGATMVKVYSFEDFCSFISDEKKNAVYLNEEFRAYSLDLFYQRVLEPHRLR